MDVQLFHISADGNDSHDGRSTRATKAGAGPWATLAGARDALRRLRATGEVSGAVTVHIHPGRYPLSAPVEFTADDSHTTFEAADPKDRPVFDGAEVLSGFREETLDGRRAWVLDLPDVPSGRRHFRSLFVNGERRPRARLPKFSPDGKGVHNVFRIGEIRFPERRALFDGDHAFKPASGDMQAWPSLHDADIVLLHYWIETRMGSPRLDPVTGWVECVRRSVFNLYESFNPKLARYYVDNLREALTEPGEWYLERSSGRLIYLPRRGESLEKTTVSAPRIHAFVRASGSAYNHDGTTRDILGGRCVENLRFRGLVFRHADWFHPQAAMLSHNRLRVEDKPLGSAPQGAANLPCAVEFRWARGCAVEGCEVSRIGFTAIGFEQGCRDCFAAGCDLHDLGGGGVRVDGCELDGPPADRTGGIRIEDTTIRDFGVVFHQGVGVLLMRAFGCTAAHNTIAHGRYTGISCGWSWGYRDTISANNRIENNLIHDIGMGVLSDMGAIYLLGVQPGTVIRGNRIHTVESADYGGWGIYPDEGSSHMLIESNWVHDTEGSPLRIHMARELVVRDNVFARSLEEGLVGIGREEGHVSATLMHNLLLGPAPLVFEGGYRGDVARAFRSDANLIWFPKGVLPPFSNPKWRKDVTVARSLAVWRRAGHDRASVVADPKACETARNFTLPPNSPAFRTGFRLHDWSKCGPRKRPS